MELNERLQKLRIKKKLSLQDLSLKIGVSSNTILSWERGKSVPNIKYLQKLANVYNISIDALIGNKKEIRKNRLFITFSIIGVALVVLLAFELLYFIIFYNVVGLYKFECSINDTKYDYEIAYNKYDLIVFESGDTYIAEDVLKNSDITHAHELKDYLNNYFDENNGSCNYSEFSK